MTPRPDRPLPSASLQIRKTELRHEIQHLRARLRADPQDVALLIQLGDRLAEMAAYRPSGFRIRRAREAYERAMLQEPGDPAPVNNLGVLECDQGEPERALRLFDRALELDPDDATIHENRSIALVRLGRLARPSIPAGLARKPGTHSAFYDPLGQQGPP